MERLLFDGCYENRTNVWTQRSVGGGHGWRAGFTRKHGSMVRKLTLRLVVRRLSECLCRRMTWSTMPRPNFRYCPAQRRARTPKNTLAAVTHAAGTNQMLLCFLFM